MAYSVHFTGTALKSLDRLPNAVRARILIRVQQLGRDPYRETRKLQRSLGFRVRVGDYRVLYHVVDSEQLVTVWRIAHRRDAYET